MAVASTHLLGAVAATAAAIPAGLYFSSTTVVDTAEFAGITPGRVLVSLENKDGFKDQGDNGKFGYKFSHYFLSTTGDDNKEEWTERLGKIDANSLKQDGFFNALKTADTKTVEKLKEACNTQYGQTSVDENKKEEWKEVWIHCSLMGSKPAVIDESTDSNETGFKTASQGTPKKFGEKLKASLISTYLASNESFWNLREKDFATGRLGTNATTGHFNKSANNRKPIKELCREAYKKPETTGATDPSETEVKKYCSLDFSAQ